MTHGAGRTSEHLSPAPPDASLDGAPSRPGLWLVVGGLVGAGLTVAVVAFVWSLLEPEPPPEAMPPPRFVDETASAGIQHSYEGGFSYFVGGGAAVFDCDSDLMPDIYLAGGDEPAALYRNVGAVAGPLSFERVADPATDLDAVTGAYPLDIDGDGITDLAVLRIGENQLLRGTGDCNFENANEDWGFDGDDAWTVGFSATWEVGDALPTMAFGTYLRSESDRTCGDHALVTPGSETQFAVPAAISPGYCTLSMLFSDWDRSGQRDLRVTNDRHYYTDGGEQLYRLVDGSLVPYDETDGWRSMQIWGMGIASEDLTGDGRPEVFLTSQGDNKLQSLAADAAGPAYDDIALERGVTAHRPFAGGDQLPSTAWHPQFADVNNDGLTDLFVSKGNVDAMPEFAMQDPSNLLIGQSDGSFTEVADIAGILDYEQARGAAVVDLNLDGMLDLVQVNREANVRIWRNVGWGDAGHPVEMGNWTAVRLMQDGANRDAVGSWIEVRTSAGVRHHEVTVGGGHASGRLGWIPFGLGEADEAEIRVTWPDGERTGWMALPVDGFAILDRAEPAPRIWAPEQ